MPRPVLLDPVLQCAVGQTDLLGVVLSSDPDTLAGRNTSNLPEQRPLFELLLRRSEQLTACCYAHIPQRTHRHGQDLHSPGVRRLFADRRAPLMRRATQCTMLHLLVGDRDLQLLTLSNPSNKVHNVLNLNVSRDYLAPSSKNENCRE